MIFSKIKKENKRSIYFLGIKLFSYTKKTNQTIKDELRYFRDWQTDFYKDRPEKFPVVLMEAEKETLIQYLRQSKNYLEFGAGGSSFLALLNSDTTVYSVESDKDWVDYLRSWTFMRNKETEGKINFFVADIGQTKAWGYPADESRKNSYPDYSSNIFARITDTDIDTVFVDGRFRVACVVASAIHYPDAVILVHDYTKRRHYHIVESLFDVTDITDTLVALKLKKAQETKALQNLYDEYKYNPD